MNNLIMVLFCISLAVIILLRAELETVNDGFFDLDNSKAMRGFWCLVVILVHIPAVYSNRIQDMIGSFAYIGVTFFFLTSGYGLTLSRDRNPDGIKVFWRKRLPKLLIVNWLINLLFTAVFTALFHTEFSFIKIISLNKWIIWLLGCYFIFWIYNLIFKKAIYWKCFTVITICVCSVLIYFLQLQGTITSTTWTPECYGFIWGIILASNRTLFLKVFSNNWLRRLLISCCIALVLGLSYLKLKPIVFWGDYLLKIILGIAILLFVLIANTRIRFGNRINMFLGSISFEIYLVHGYVIDMLNGIRVWKYSAIYIMSCILLAVLVAYVVHLISNVLVMKTRIIFEGDKYVRKKA